MVVPAGADVAVAVAEADVADSLNDLPELGVGIGFREPLRPDIFLNRSEIDFLEITSDHYLDATRKKLTELELLREHFRLIPHSLDLSLGSAEGIDADYLEKLADLVSLLKPAWFSDHICFTGSGGARIGHLAPVPYTEESLKVFVKNIETVRRRISTPLILENISYNVEYPWSEMTEASFIRRLLEATDCGLLLDVTNLYVNSRNLGFEWLNYLDELPMDRVVQVHFVGSRLAGTRLVDAHADPTEEEIWNVFREVAVRCDIKGAILERDASFPVFTELLAELRMARSVMNSYVLS